MGDAIGKLLDWAKSPKQSGIVFLAALFLIILPRSAASKIGISGLDKYRGWVAIVATVSCAVLLVELLSLLWRHVTKTRKQRKLEAAREENLRNLSREERGILAGYTGDSDTRYLLTNDGNVGALSAKGIIYLGSKQGRMTKEGSLFAYNIQPWAKTFISEHPEVLAGAQEPSRPPSEQPRSWGRIRRELEREE